MANLILPTRWLQQPQGRVEIDWSHPLAKGLVFYTIGNQRNAPDLVTGSLGAPLGNADISAGAFGTGFNSTSTTTTGWNFPLSDALRTVSTAMTFAVSLNWVQAAVHGQLAVVPYHLSSWTAPFNAIGFHRNGSTESLLLQISVNSTTYKTAASSTFTLSGLHQSLVGTRNGASVAFYRNGLALTTSNNGFTATDTATFGTGNRLSLMNRSPGVPGEGSIGTVFWTAIWNRDLSLAEVREINAAPYQVLRPISNRLFFDAVTVPEDHSGAATIVAAGNVSAATTTVRNSSASISLAPTLGVTSGSTTRTGSASASLITPVLAVSVQTLRTGVALALNAIPSLLLTATTNRVGSAAITLASGAGGFSSGFSIGFGRLQSSITLTASGSPVYDESYTGVSDTVTLTPTFTVSSQTLRTGSALALNVTPSLLSTTTTNRTGSAVLALTSGDGGLSSGFSSGFSRIQSSIVLTAIGSSIEGTTGSASIGTTPVLAVTAATVRITTASLTVAPATALTTTAIREVALSVAHAATFTVVSAGSESSSHSIAFSVAPVLALTSTSIRIAAGFGLSVSGVLAPATTTARLATASLALPPNLSVTGSGAETSSRSVTLNLTPTLSTNTTSIRATAVSVSLDGILVPIVATERLGVLMLPVTPTLSAAGSGVETSNRTASISANPTLAVSTTTNRLPLALVETIAASISVTGTATVGLAGAANITVASTFVVAALTQRTTSAVLATASTLTVDAATNELRSGSGSIAITPSLALSTVTERLNALALTVPPDVAVVGVGAEASSGNAGLSLSPSFSLTTVTARSASLNLNVSPSLAVVAASSETVIGSANIVVTPALTLTATSARNAATALPLTAALSPTATTIRFGSSTASISPDLVVAGVAVEGLGGAAAVSASPTLSVGATTTIRTGSTTLPASAALVGVAQTVRIAGVTIAAPPMVVASGSPQESRSGNASTSATPALALAVITSRFSTATVASSPTIAVGAVTTDRIGTPIISSVSDVAIEYLATQEDAYTRAAALAAGPANFNVVAGEIARVSGAITESPVPSFTVVSVRVSDGSSASIGVTPAVEVVAFTTRSNIATLVGVPVLTANGVAVENLMPVAHVFLSGAVNDTLPLTGRWQAAVGLNGRMP